MKFQVKKKLAKKTSSGKDKYSILAVTQDGEEAWVNVLATSVSSAWQEGQVVDFELSQDKFGNHWIQVPKEEQKSNGFGQPKSFPQGLSTQNEFAKVNQKLDKILALLADSQTTPLDEPPVHDDSDMPPEDDSIPF